MSDVGRELRLEKIRVIITDDQELWQAARSLFMLSLGHLGKIKPIVDVETVRRSEKELLAVLDLDAGDRAVIIGMIGKIEGLSVAEGGAAQE